MASWPLAAGVPPDARTAARMPSVVFFDSSTLCSLEYSACANAIKYQCFLNGSITGPGVGWSITGGVATGGIGAGLGAGFGPGLGAGAGLPAVFDAQAGAGLAKTTVTVLPRVPEAVESKEAEPPMGKTANGGDDVRETLFSSPAVALTLKTAVTLHAYKPKNVPFFLASL